MDCCPRDPLDVRQNTPQRKKTNIMAKVKLTTIQSRAEFESKIDQAAQLETSQKLLEAELDAKILKLKERYGAEIEGHKKEIKKLTTECAQFAASNMQSIFGKNKSSETALARFGFRLGQPTVKNANKLKDCDVMAALLKEKDSESYISKKLSLDKSAIRTAIENGVEWLKKFFYVAQDESFYIEAKIESNEK